MTRLIILIIISCLFSTSAVAQHPPQSLSESPKTQTTEENHENHKPDVVSPTPKNETNTVEITAAPKVASEENNTAHKKDRATQNVEEKWWSLNNLDHISQIDMAVFALLGLAIGAVGVYLLIKTLEASQNPATAAIDATTIAKAQLSPAIRIVSCKMTQTSAGDFEILVDFENTGQSSALDLMHTSIFSHHESKSEFPDALIFEDHKDEPSIVFPMSDTKRQRVKPTNDEIGDIFEEENPRRIVHVNGLITWKDMFDEPYCLQYSFSESTWPYRGQMTIETMNQC